MLSPRKAVKWLFGMAVAGALGFGATGAGASVTRTNCTPWEDDDGYIGTCTSPQDCSDRCARLYPDNEGLSNNCSGGCCVCFL